MVKLRNQYELKLMRDSGKIAAAALKRAIEGVKVGVREIDVDKVAEKTIYKLGGDLSYKTVPNYPFATCITVNDRVVHGLPTERQFVKEDIVSIDLAVKFKGWHTDCAWSVLLGKDPKKQVFLKVGEKALWDGIEKAVDGNTVGDISNAIQSRVERAGLSVVRSLVGHGIGKNLHEDPEIPGYGPKGAGIRLKSGMTLAIEVIYTNGKGDVVLDEDGWTFKTADGSLGGLFEMTVIVGKKEAEVLTDWRKV
ncbi:type I methionyl aminopeptidase [Candidatus Daviesbacteria bacterium]|nr:type I methionyl aminopeptidase [Candidatus Daviesbacteria bacterium]